MLQQATAYSQFNQTVNQYFNSGCLNRSDFLLSVISHRLVFWKNARKIISLFNALSEEKNDKTKTEKVSTEVYKSSNPYVLKMRDFLEKKIKQHLAGAYIHGSIGTAEEICYSDFDGLLILKDTVFRSVNYLAELAWHINSSRKIMKQSDPLQHHGWFIITEKEINNNYPQAFFPLELFEFTKSIFSDKGLNLELKINYEETDFEKSFFQLAKSITLKLENKKYPQNIYALKNLFSEIMLLPSLYLQAKNKRGIFKKFSFEEAKKDFSNDEWATIDIASRIRNDWETHLTSIQQYFLQSTHPFFFKLALRLLPQKKENIPNEKFYDNLLNLIATMKLQLEKKPY